MKLRRSDVLPGRQRRPENMSRQPDAVPAGQSTKNLAIFWLQRMGLLIFLITAAAAAANVVSLSPSVKVLPLSTGSSQSFLRQTTVYETAANQVLMGSILNRTKLTVDTGGLRQRLLAQFPELADVSVTLPLLAHRPIVYIQPANPALVIAANNGSFVVDTYGKTILRAGNSVQLPANLPILTDQSGLQVQLNHQALTYDNVTFIRTVLAELATKQYNVSRLALPPTSSELDVHLAGQPYLVKFNLENNDPREQAGTFLAAVKSLKSQNTVPSQYVDVRVDGRAYYQ